MGCTHKGGIYRVDAVTPEEAKIKAENQDWIDTNENEDKISHVLV